MDDGLRSVSTEEEAVQLVSEARQIHKFISNHQEVLASIPKEECAEMARNQDLALGQPQIERASGVHWCVSSDQSQCRVVVKIVAPTKVTTEPRLVFAVRTSQL